MNIKVTIEGNTIEIERGQSFLQAVKLAGFSKECVAVRLGGEVCGLTYIPKVDCEIFPLMLNDKLGRLVYERSLIMLFIAALERAYKGARATVEHTIGNGMYITVKLPGEPLMQEHVRNIKEAMRELVEADLPLERERIPILDAVEFFESKNQLDKLRLLSFRKFSYFDLYKLDGIRDYFYGVMVPSTGYMDVFDLRFHLPGLMLERPDPDDPSKVSEPRISRKLSRVLEESERWDDLLGCRVIADLNGLTADGGIREFVRISEALHEHRISDIAETIAEQGSRVVLISGPSSSGKTTFSNRLYVQLRAHGLKPELISLDDFYRNRDEIEYDLVTGEQDLEHIEALDVKRLNSDLERLLVGEEVELPVFDFKAHKRRAVGRTLKVRPDQPLIIEGIHGLNPMLSRDIPSEMKYKIYISALTTINLDDYNRVKTTDARLLRRLVRDHATRNSSMEATFSMWPSVQRGEERWIFPYQEEADTIFNSSLPYELAVMKKYVYPLLMEVPRSSAYYYYASTILKFLNYIQDAHVEDEIPPTSILREFIGGCTFYRD